MGEDDGGLSGQVKTGWERGQTLVLAAFLLIIMVGMLAIVIDLGNAYVQRRAMQNAADAAALAGVRELALGHSTGVVTTAVQKFATEYNSAQTFVPEILAQSVMVSASKTFPTYFGGVIGWPSFGATAFAEAKYSAACGPGGVQPIAVSKAMALMETDKELRFWDSVPKETDLCTYTLENCVDILSDSANHGWLQLPDLGGGKKDIVNTVNAGGSELSIPFTDNEGGVMGRWLSSVTGVGVTALQAAEDQWVAGTEIIVPVYTLTRSGGGGLEYFVTGFALFGVSNIAAPPPGNPKYIAGNFVQGVTGGEGDCPVDYGLRVINLVQ